MTHPHRDRLRITSEVKTRWHQPPPTKGREFMHAKKTLGVGFAAIAAVGLSLGTATSAQAEMVGTGCSAYAQQVPTGPGSVQGMSMDPVAVAASNNPMLTTLTKAISGQLNPQVNLV